MAKVSVIIAAYNIQEYIGRCIESCINQTLEDIEIIVVNDGSTDKTLDIINKYDDSRIKVINKKNEGLIEARKSGFNIAVGEYILFVDGDDWIKLETLNTLYNFVKEKNYDIVCYKWIWKYDDGTEKKGWDVNSSDIQKNVELLDILFSGKITHSIWSKFIRRKFIIDNKIEFPSEFSYGEDLAFTYTLAMYKPLYKIIDEYLYYYYKRSGSLDNIVSNKTVEITKALKFVRKQLLKKNLYEKYKEEFEYMCFMQNYYMRKNYIFSNKNKISTDIYKGWKSLKININSKNNRFYRKMYEKDTKRARILEEIFKRNYTFGYLYYKIKG